MAFKHFYKGIFLRLFIVVVLSAITTFLCLRHFTVYMCVSSFAFLLIALINVVLYFNKINKWISFFLLGIKNEDTSLKIPAQTGNKAIDQVFEGMNHLNEMFKQTKIEISTQEQYFQSVINQSVTGLFSVNENGRVININPSASKFTALQKQHHINALSKIDKSLPQLIQDKRNTNGTAVFENKYGQKLLFKISRLNTLNEEIILVAVSDITKELDSREVDAWVKLARTLSHEIMNNITPITTLSQVVLEYYSINNKTILPENINEKIINNTIKALRVIEERSVALMNFVENYRKFTKLPEPKYQKEDLAKLIDNCIIAISSYPNFEKIKLEKHLLRDVYFNTDSKLLSQVIINLLKNAYEALDDSSFENSIIKVKLNHEFDYVKISIANSGKTISPEIKEQIFVPFFTTKENGSGIGLSLSKQILLQMNGDIFLKNTIDNLTCFEVVLKKIFLSEKNE